jgi:hypothetical protein
MPHSPKPETIEVQTAQAVDPAAICSPFALLLLTSLAVKRFNSKDEQRIAMDALQTKGVRFVALKYHHGAQTYIVPEVYK